MVENKYPSEIVPAYEFEDYYPAHLAREVADERKNSAFSVLSGLSNVSAKLTTFMSRSSKILVKDDDIELVRSERRLEPFWHVKATRTISYKSEKIYRAEVENNDAQSVIVEGSSVSIPVNNPRNMHTLTGFISFKVQEECKRDIEYEEIIDGMERAHIKEKMLQNYLNDKKFIRKPLQSEVVEPILLDTGIMQRARKKLLETTIINERELFESTRLDNLSLYFRPVFAFEYRHKKDNRTAIIEVDGLTGEVIDSGTSWFSEKANQEKMQRLVKGVIIEVAGSIVPGGASIASFLIE